MFFKTIIISFLIISVIIPFCLCQNLVANIISISTNQPCTDVDASLTNSTEKLGCSLSTILQLGLSPGLSTESSSIKYSFRAFPDSTGTYQQDFGTDPVNNNIDPNNLCANPSSSQCKSLIENTDLFTLEIDLSMITTRWKLINTGLQIPSSYYYQTRPYGINSAMPTTPCGIDPYSDVANDSREGIWNYAKPVNSIVINKNNITDQSCFGPYSETDIYAQYLLSSYILNVPGEPIDPSVNCSDPNNVCSSCSTSIGSQGEISYQFGTALNVIDSVYNRWLNGTLGCGQAVSTDRLYQGTGVADYTKSSLQCTKPIQSGSNDYTTNVCPGNPLPNFKARNSNVYPAYCVNGPCGGQTEPFCALVAGFQYGFSRCMMSRQSAINFLLPLTQDPTSSCTIDLITTGFYSQLSPTTASQWYYCLQSAYNYYKNKYSNPTPDDLIKSFFNATDFEICGAYLQQISIPASGPASDYCPYPNILHQTQKGPECIIPFPQNSWTTQNDQIADVRQFVTPFQDYNPNDYLNPVGFCGSVDKADSGAGNHVNEPDRTVSPTISTSPCPCTGLNGWQDTVIPVGPVCSVYRLERPGEPIYTMTVKVKDNKGNTCTLTLGPVAGEGGTSVYSGACNGTVASFIVNVDYPRGNVLPAMDGLIVICGTITNDNAASNPTAQTFYGGSDYTGQTDPYSTLGNTRAYRTPLPSTFRDAFRTSGQTIPTDNSNTNCTKDSLGSCAWWYYVPPNEVEQYGEQCTDLGWMNYGVSSTVSTTIMCNGPAGTCVPGYDIRNYNAKRYDPNATDALDGFPEKYPTVKTPLFIARTFVDYEIDHSGIPLNLPPGWDAYSQGYFLFNDYLYSNLNFFSNGNIFIRTKLAIAGQLIEAATSFSPGQLCYPLSQTGGQYSCGAASTNLNNQPFGTCSVYVNSGDGTLFTVVHNTGTQAGTYTIMGNCTNGASLNSLFDFSVAPNDYATVNIPLNYITTTGETVVCTIDLYLAFIDQKLDTIEYICQKFENKYDAPGTQVYGTEQNQNGGLYDPPNNPASDGNSCDGTSPPWYCFTFRGIGALMSWIWSLFTLILIVLAMIIIFETFNRFIKNETTTERLKASKQKNLLKNKVQETDNLIAAKKEQERLGQTLTRKQQLKQQLLEEYQQVPTEKSF